MEKLWGSKNVDNVHTIYVKFANAQVKSKQRQLDTMCRFNDWLYKHVFSNNIFYKTVFF